MERREQENRIEREETMSRIPARNPRDYPNPYVTHHPVPAKQEPPTESPPTPSVIAPEEQVSPRTSVEERSSVEDRSSIEEHRSVDDRRSIEDRHSIEGSGSEEPISKKVSPPVMPNVYSSLTPEFPETVPVRVQRPVPLEKEKGATARVYGELALGIGCILTGGIGGPLTLVSNLYGGIGLFCLIVVGFGLAFHAGRSVL
jgi:hypothetical protein